MEFHLEFNPKPFQKKIQHPDRLLLMGSCFTEQIGQKLDYHHFKTLQNPHGILFNPFSIATALEEYMQLKQYTRDDLFFDQELYGSWQHHTRFSAPEQEVCLDMINRSQSDAHQFLKSADWLLITLGSAFVYRLMDGRVVANCHKVPPDRFEKRLLKASEMVERYNELFKLLLSFNPYIQVIFTISPVRHLRDGFIENNRSKATLIEAVHTLTETWPMLQYFPAYELVIDDLRDYRFYAEDMVHPNYAATQYVWEKFIQTAIDKNATKTMETIASLMLARLHKPFHPQSEAHHRFMKARLEDATRLQENNSYLNLKEMIDYFSLGLPK
jgi:hypothetical protein